MDPDHEQGRRSCGPIYNVGEVFSDPQVQHLGIATEVEHAKLGRFRVLQQAARLRTPATVLAPTPEIGEHTDEVLKELNYNAAQIAKLRQGGVV